MVLRDDFCKIKNKKIKKKNYKATGYKTTPATEINSKISAIWKKGSFWANLILKYGSSSGNEPFVNKTNKNESKLIRMKVN